MDSDTDLYRFHSGAPDVETYERAVAELIDSAEKQAREIGIEVPAYHD